MPKTHPTDEPRPGDPVQPQPQPSTDPSAATVEQIIEVEEQEEPAGPE